MDMRKIFLGWIGLYITSFVFAQRECRTFEYGQQLFQKNSVFQTQREKADQFVSHQQSSRILTDAGRTITIPVVVHVLYHYPAENISDDLVKSQITALNRDFRKQNPDTIKIPVVFKELAADCGIQFQLATVDPRGRATSGVVHKYTPITKWKMDYKIKASSEMGDDGWDPKNYLNIWVGSLEQFLGYSSMPGDPADRDGVVISYTAFGTKSTGIYRLGRTAVHETGHWLGLRHLWGDEDCGDDGVDDTPQQATFTNGCPSSIRISCNNGPNGDMYMDYMDFTNDDCLVMFTRGQKQKMRALFEPDGPRNSILSSAGLGVPLIEEIPLPDSPPQWLHVKIYPDPAGSELTLNVEFDTRWLGKELQVINISGQTEMRHTISAKVQKLDISKLKPGLYFIRAVKDGDKIMEKFIKL
jgi:hypothetical protein